MSGQRPRFRGMTDVRSARSVSTSPADADDRLEDMEPERAERIVARLRAGGVMAHVAHRGVYTVGIRVVIPDGREVVWDTDGAAGLEAQILRDGVLVGFVPEIPDSADLDDDGVVAAIARTDYGTDPSGA